MSRLQAMLIGLWRLSLSLALFSAAVFSFLTWQDARGPGFVREYMASSSAMEAARLAQECSSQIRLTDHKVEAILEGIDTSEPMHQRILKALASH